VGRSRKKRGNNPIEKEPRKAKTLLIGGDMGGAEWIERGRCTKTHKAQEKSRIGGDERGGALPGNEE